MENRINLNDGLIKQNMVFMSGMLIAPVIACATSLSKSLALCFVFSFVSFAAIILCRFIPRTIVYTVRVTLYTIAAAVFYIPACLLAELVFGEAVITSAGVYLPILVTNSLILSKTETRFYLEPPANMVRDVIEFIIGFDAACALTGFFRELLASGRVGGAEVPVLFTIPALETTFGGFLFVGIGAGLFRAVYNRSKKRASEEADDSEDSLAEYAEDMGEFLVGKHGRSEKIRIYKAAVGKAKNENELLEMEFLSNRDVLAAFEAIVSEGQELSAPPEENAEPQETGPDAEEKEDTDNGSVS
ncbi:MAG TPA: hypothetical protein DDX72_09880 [Ruminococcaceae bacterium]|nr:hypothetical protein [Oscillospiraceae bacterium]